MGARLEGPDLDVGRMTTDVVHHDNGVNLDSTDLPLPDGIPILDPWRP